MVNQIPESDIVYAARIIADAIYRLAESQEMLARATAGEFDQDDGDIEPARYMDGSPVR